MKKFLSLLIVSLFVVGGLCSHLFAGEVFAVDMDMGGMHSGMLAHGEHSVDCCDGYPQDVNALLAVKFNYGQKSLDNRRMDTSLHISAPQENRGREMSPYFSNDFDVFLRSVMRLE